MKNKSKPDLRLSNYNENWEVRKLNEMSNKVTEKNKNNQYKETLTNSAEFGIISQRDFFEKDISNEKNLNGYYVVQQDDFVYNPRISNFAPVGPIKRNKLGRTGVMSPLYYVFRTKEVDKTYLESYFSSMKWHSFMKLNGDSGARSDRFAIKDSTFGEMPIPYPSQEEQVEIGKFFNALDNSIFHKEQELETLKQTKQGFLQKMFPKEGETVPEIRFVGFQEDWEEKKLSEIVESFNGSRVPVDSEKRLKGIYPYYGASGIIDYVNDYIFDGEYVLLAEDGANIITRNSPIAYITEGKFWVNNHAHVMRLKRGSNYFLLQQLERQSYERFNSGTAQPKLNAKIVNNIIIKIPTEDEQIKIGEFFKQLDKTIELQEKELEALKQTKKAFLQKMFV